MGLKLININKSFGLPIGDRRKPVLQNVSLEIEDGEMVAIVGRKGSGKTTLMNIMTGLVRPDSGSYLIDGKVMGIGRAVKLAYFRAKKCGIITREPLLVPDLTLYDNITMPLNHCFMFKKKKLKRAREVLRGLGLKGKGKFYPEDFSILDRQKICAGRAMIGEPKYIFADEPTGCLSSADVEKYMDFLEVLNSAGYTIIVFTHSKRVASHCHRMIPVTGEDAPQNTERTEEALPEMPGHTVVGTVPSAAEPKPAEDDTEAKSDNDVNDTAEESRSPEVYEIFSEGPEVSEEAPKNEQPVTPDTEAPIAEETVPSETE